MLSVLKCHGQLISAHAKGYNKHSLGVVHPTAKIANKEHLHKGGTITVSYNGSVGETFYQEEPFWASDDVNVLYPKFNLTKNIAMFKINHIHIL